MAKNKVLEATQKAVGILEPLDTEERVRVIQAALTLLGDSAAVPLGGARDSDSHDGRKRGAATEKSYFDSKDPRTKGEELAVAARYREEHSDATVSSREELKAATVAARRNFDDNNFRRDLENARTKGLFNRGTGKDSAVLSHYGQKYVDALPDRTAVKAVPKPKGAGVRHGGRKAPKPSLKR